jgi:hypothetical protein
VTLNVTAVAAVTTAKICVRMWRTSFLFSWLLSAGADGTYAQAKALAMREDECYGAAFQVVVMP